MNYYVLIYPHEGIFVKTVEYVCSDVCEQNIVHIQSQNLVISNYHKVTFEMKMLEYIEV